MAQGKTEGSGGEKESLSEVLERAEAAGYAVSERQLKRWRDEGLVPSPDKVGLGRGKGTVALYPPGTARRVIEIARALEEERSLGRAAWHLWFQGLVPTDLVRRGMTGVIAERGQQLAEAWAQFEAGDPGNPIDRESRGEGLDELSDFRRAAGSDVFSGLVRLFLEGFEAQPSADRIERELEWEDSELEEGLAALTESQVPAAWSNEFPDLQADDFAALLETIFTELHPDGLADWLDKLEKEELKQLRERAKVVHSALFPQQAGKPMKIETFLITVGFVRLCLPIDKVLSICKERPKAEPLFNYVRLLVES